MTATTDRTIERDFLQYEFFLDDDEEYLAFISQLGVETTAAPPATTTPTSAPTTTSTTTQRTVAVVVPEGSDDRLSSLLAAYTEDEVEALCASIVDVQEYIAGAVSCTQLSRLSPVDFWTRVNGPRLLAMAAMPSSCQAELVRALLSLVTPVASRVPVADSAAFGRATGLSQFCNDNTPLLRVVIQQDPTPARISAMLIRFCPDLFGTRASRIAALYQALYAVAQSRPASGASGLMVHRARAFSDALRTLNDAPAASLAFLPVVRYIGESGTDAGGLGRDWFSMVTRLVFGANSTDPAGGLFAPRDGIEYTELNLARPFNPSTRGAYRAVGRLLAMSVTLRFPLGVPLPRMFFSRLLDRPVTLADLELDDPAMHRGLLAVLQGGEDMVRAVAAIDDDAECPSAEQYVADQLRELISHGAEERLGAIREGFDSLIPLATVTPIITGDDLRSLVYGTPEISVDDLAAHTNYDGHTFTAESPQIRWLWDWLRRSDNDVRRKFLRFVTGLSQLPVEGMAGLRGRIYITRSHAGDLAPRSHTCSFGLDMPVYRTPAELEEWMGAAVSSDGFGMA